MTMPFGKHKGEDLEDLPLDYLRWLDAKVDLREPLYSAVRDEIEDRVGCPPPPRGMGTTIAVPPANVALVRQIIDAGYRSIAARLHPDRGGDTGEMQRLNQVVGSLRGQLAQIAGGAR